MNIENITDSDWRKWKFTEEAVLIFIRVKNRLLLIHKKRGLGKGKVNAPGGRIEKGETQKNAAIRECIEEVGLAPINLTKVGELNFIFIDGYSLKGYVFFANSYSGNMIETDEADPFWCDEDKIPYENMWADDVYWLPLALAGGTFEGFFVFDEDKMLSKKIDIIGRWEH